MQREGREMCDGSELERKILSPAGSEAPRPAGELLFLECSHLQTFTSDSYERTSGHF